LSKVDRLNSENEKILEGDRTERGTGGRAQIYVFGQEQITYVDFFRIG